MISNRVSDMLRDLFRYEPEPTETRMVGEVLGVDDDGTAWVHVLGGAERTPVSATDVQLAKGDIVNLYMGEGRAEVTGNRSDPATTASRVESVRQASATVERIAQEAKDAAEATGQRFWTDDGGVHVTEVPQEQWLSAPSGRNMLLNSLGFLFRAALTNLVSVTQGAISFWDGEDNGAGNILASFGRDGITFNAEVPQRVGGDDAYVEWDGSSTLRIIASEIMIGESSAATQTALEETTESLETSIDSVADVAKANAQTLGGLGEYMRISTSPAALELGAETGAKARMTGESLDFSAGEDAQVVASIGVDEDGEGRLMGTRATFTQDVSVGEATEDTGGYWRWEQRSNGNLCLKWIAREVA